MSEHHILNPRATWDDDLQDNPCPDYGFGAKLPNTRVAGKAPGGQPFTREAANTGHSFSLSWLNRSYLLTQRVKRFYEQHADGYFTLVDRDGGGRHYVGRFVGDFNRTQAANDSYDVRDLQFEEVPGAPMLQYPNDWQRDSIALYPFNDFGTQLAAVQGAWSRRDDNPGPPAMVNGGGIAGDFLCMEYRGYGFQLWMRTGPGEGQVQLSLDGAVLATVDLYHGGYTAGPQLVFQQAGCPLDLHRVKVTMLNSKNSNSGGFGATFCSLQVMR